MKQTINHSRAALALLVSSLLHVIFLWLTIVLLPPEVERQVFRVHHPRYKLEFERFKPRPVIPVPRQFLERIRTESTPRQIDAELSMDNVSALPEAEIPLPELARPLDIEMTKETLESQQDTLDITQRFKEHITELPLALDLVELDAQRRQTNITLIDPETGKLKRGYIHVPAYINPGGESISAPLIKALNLLRRGFFVSESVPLEETMHLYPTGPPLQRGWVHIDGFPDPDPIHKFILYPRRHLLHFSEMKQFGVILLDYIDVESTEAMVRYLVEGGFGIVNRGHLNILTRALKKDVGPRVERMQVELSHPLFRSFFDITTYWEANRLCPYPVSPLPGLELDGRLVAVVVPEFVNDAPCPANKLFVNALAYGLMQPSQMGGRYLSRKKSDSRSKETAK